MSEDKSAFPLVSIISSCYNVGDYVEDALDSIYAQDYPNFEVILVDDGSTDDTYSRLSALKEKYGFQLYQQENGGVSAGLNCGLQNARGVYVATPDLDDILMPGVLRSVVEYMEAHPQVGCAGGHVVYVDANGNEVKRKKNLSLTVQHFADTLREAKVIGPQGTLYRMAALKAVGFYDPAIKVQDFQIVLRITHAGYEAHVLPMFLAKYRRHSGNLSRNYKKVLDADRAAIQPYQGMPGYDQARVKLINKALKYAVVENRHDAWELFRSIPLLQWNKVTWRRFFRFIRHLMSSN